MLDVIKPKFYHQKSLWLLFTFLSFTHSVMAVYPNVESMLVAARPTFSCPTSGSRFCTLYDNLDALTPYPTQYSAALQTLVPLVDGSLTVTSESAMREIVQVINGRLMEVKQKEKYTGYAGGDEIKTAPQVEVQFKNQLPPAPLKKTSTTDTDPKIIIEEKIETISGNKKRKS